MRTSIYGQDRRVAEEAGVEPTEDARAPSNGFEARAPHRERYSSAVEHAAAIGECPAGIGARERTLRGGGGTNKLNGERTTEAAVCPALARQREGYCRRLVLRAVLLTVSLG